MSSRSGQNTLQPQPSLQAVIDAGATSIRMTLAEASAGQPFRTLESLEQTVHLGRDTFRAGKISPETIEACVQVFRDFNTVLHEYKLADPSRIRAVATSAVAEATNSDVLLDRIFMATGISVDILDNADINRSTYYSILPLLESRPDLRKGTLLAVEAGGGHTTALGLHNGTVLFAHTHRFGSFRTHELLETADISSSRYRQLVQDEIRSGIRPMIENLADRREIKVLMLGSEARLAADHIKPGWQTEGCVRLGLGALDRLVASVLETPVEALVREYDLPFAAAQALGPALMTMQSIPRMLGCKELLIGIPTMRDGLLRETAAGGAWDERFCKQILHCAAETARHYRVDRKHAQITADLAGTLFRALQSEHRMLARYETVLKVAALLHDTGAFISNSSHHKHSQYLIQNSDLFGLSRQDLTIAALTARYHRRALPKASHPDYTALARINRLRVCKLAAILRVADALDRGHAQRIVQPHLELTSDRLEIGVPNPADCTVEELALKEKSDLFEQIYGKRVVLVKHSERRNPA